MSEHKTFCLQDKYFRYIDIAICLPFVLLPLFLNLPYRVNIFLSWEGAYRFYDGQVPYRDFGLPMGFCYWLIPGLFFKVFGPALFTLVKAQVFINALSLLSVRGILYNLKNRPVVVSLTLLVFCLTYVITNFWPWYNHSVVVFELCSFYFLTLFATGNNPRPRWIYLLVSSLLTSFAFFTKQDVGALGFLISLMVVGYVAFYGNERRFLVGYIVSFLVITAVAVIPFGKYDFFYWFNYGQEPHNARVSPGLFINTVLASGQFEKLYLFLFFIIIFLRKDHWQEIFKKKESVIFIILCVSLIGQALITQVTSPLPTGHMTYFHAFGFVLLANFSPLVSFTGKLRNLVVVAFVVVMFYSEGYWKYLTSYLPIQTEVDNQATGKTRMKVTASWAVSPFKGFEKVKMPPSTIEGIGRLVTSSVVRKEDLKVLNMSELTPLAHTIGYTPLTGHPLWYHMNIGIFRREVDSINQKIAVEYYDLVLFEDIPSLNNFYPYEVRDTLLKYYEIKDKFLAPRKLEDSYIEVFTRKDVSSSVIAKE